MLIEGIRINDYDAQSPKHRKSYAIKDNAVSLKKTMQPPTAGDPPHKQSEQLRKEAEEVKRCFTQFSFQALTFTTVVLGLIARELPSHPYLGMLSLIAVFLLLVVKRIGNYKYTTANRNYAYQLHLSRLPRYSHLESKQSTEQMRNLDWEEAMFAWRIVQPTIFNAIYQKTGRAARFEVRGELKDSAYPWWDTAKLKGGASHHPGSYLKYMQIFLHWFAVVAIFPALSSSWYYFETGVLRHNGMLLDAIVGWVFPLTTMSVIIHVFLQKMRDDAYRHLLETQILSIQTAAVVWRCAVVAHFRALEKTRMYRGYTKALGNEALDIVKNVEQIHEWLEDENSFPMIASSSLRSVTGRQGFQHRIVDEESFSI